MPRGKKRTTQSGDDAQVIESVPGQRYGEGVEQQAMQRAMPAPNRAAMPTVVSPASNPGVSPGQPPAADPNQLQAMLGQAPMGLLAGTQMPEQPVTTGLSTGPGAGPSALGGMRAQTPLSRTIRTLYERTGDPMFRDLADRAGL